MKPKIVCLCGSVRFKEEYLLANFNETLSGKIVLSVGCGLFPEREPALNEHVKEMLDKLHKHKIDLADEVLFLDVGGYMGKSTTSELQYAKEKGKIIRFFSSDPEYGGTCG